MKSLLYSILALFLICGTASADGKAPPEIKPGEKYSLSITGILKEEKERIDGMYPISSTGAINIPFVGPTQIVGMTVPQAEKTLEDALKEKGIYRNPHITLKLTEEAGKPQPKNLAWLSE